MLRALTKHVGRMTLLHPKFWSAVSNLAVSQSPTEAQAIFQRVVDSKRRAVGKANWQPWLSAHEFNTLKTAYTQLFLSAYFHRPVSDQLKSATDSLPVPIFRLQGEFLYTDTCWIAAMQQELGLDLVLPELLQIRKYPNTNLEFADLIHDIHKTTFHLLPLSGLPLTLETIYRGAVKHDQELQIRGDIGKYPMTENIETVVDREKHIMCCSIKPHACENYDFAPVRAAYFVVARAMEDVGPTEICVLPTVLFTLNGKAPIRFKGNFEQKQLLIFTKERIEMFLRFFEVPLN